MKSDSGASRLIHAIRRILRCPAGPGGSQTRPDGPDPARTPAPLARRYAGEGGLDCQRPDAPADLPITHGLQLAAIEGRLAKLESQMTNQNRLLLVGIIALVGDLAKQLLQP